MSNRRKFLSHIGAALAGAGATYLLSPKTAQPSPQKNESEPENPGPLSVYKDGLVLSTWIHGIEANAAAWEVINSGGKAIDAAEQGVRVTEADASGGSVGIGGMPDRDGNVTLDACIMDSDGNAGSVCFLQNIMHPISVARKVMDETPHVILAGKGALKFALDNGFEEEDLLTPDARKRWKEWREESNYDPVINVENHDTIGLISMDKEGNLAGACTTSGLAFKMHGRVGDSPIIGAGLFVDNEIGAATATGMGEAVLKTLGSFLIVELMRQGKSPQEACEEAVKRIAAKQNYHNIQIGYIAVNKAGEIGGYAVHPGFNYALHKSGNNEMHDVDSLTK